MEIKHLYLKNDNPTLIELGVVEGDVTATYHLINTNNVGEAFIKAAEAPVERFTLVPMGEDVFTSDDIYSTLLTQRPDLILKTPYGEMAVGMLIVGVLGLEHEANQSTAKLTVHHQYRSKPFLPSARKDLSVTWERDVGFAYLFDLLGQIALSDDVTTEVGASTKHTSVNIRYTGTTDMRHLAMNERLAKDLGPYVGSSV